MQILTAETMKEVIALIIVALVCMTIAAVVHAGITNDQDP